MKTAQEAKKERERGIAIFYLGIMGIKGVLQDHERPDFLATTAGGSIGIEVTEYHQPKLGTGYKRTEVEAAWDELRSEVVAYRQDHRDLDDISVRLEFKGLEVPGRRDRGAFIRGVHGLAGAALGARLLRIEDGHDVILRQYLRSVQMKRVRFYMEWNWNHDVAGVGTNDDELMGLLASKFALRRGELTELHLVVAGDGQSGGTYIGCLPAEWIEGFDRLNAALDASEYDAAAVLNYEESVCWRRGQGWSDVVHKK